MGDKSAIEWTDATWNPIRGCSRVSEGCRFCYAERTAVRHIKGGDGTRGAYLGLVKSTPNGPRWTGEIRFVEKALALPLRWRDPRRVFVNSMSDLFHEKVPDGWVMRILNVMAPTPQHTYQILTKRPDRMRSFFARWADVTGEDFEFKNARGPEEVRRVHPSPRGQLFAAMLDAMGKPPKGCAYPSFDWMQGMLRWPATFHNIWLGVSVENQAAADERIPLVLKTPAAIRFLSVEPLLGPVDLGAYFYEGIVPRPPIDWVIVGGESGPGARPCDVAWVRSIVEQCRAAGVPVFVKQLGARPIDSRRRDIWCLGKRHYTRPVDDPMIEDTIARISDGRAPGYTVEVHRLDLRDRKGGDMAEWIEPLRVREFPW